MKILLETEFFGLPPTVNQIYRNASTRQRYKTKEVIDFENFANLLFCSCKKNSEAYKGKVALQISFFVQDNRKWDLDNRLKVLQDCLQKSEIIEDDSQIDFLYVERYRNCEMTKTAVYLFVPEEKEDKQNAAK